MLNPGKWINGRTSIDPLSGKSWKIPLFDSISNLAVFFLQSIYLCLSIYSSKHLKDGKYQNPEISHSPPFMTKVMWALPFNLFVFGYFSIFFLHSKFKPCPKPLQHLLRRTALPVQVPAPQSALAPGGIGHPLHLGPWQWLLSNIHGTHPGCVWNSGI